MKAKPEPVYHFLAEYGDGTTKRYDRPLTRWEFENCSLDAVRQGAERGGVNIKLTPVEK